MKQIMSNLFFRFLSFWATYTFSFFSKKKEKGREELLMIVFNGGE